MGAPGELAGPQVSMLTLLAWLLHHLPSVEPSARRNLSGGVHRDQWGSTKIQGVHRDPVGSTGTQGVHRDWGSTDTKGVRELPLLPQPCPSLVQKQDRTVKF